MLTTFGGLMPLILEKVLQALCIIPMILSLGFAPCFLPVSRSACPVPVSDLGRNRVAVHGQAGITISMILSRRFSTHDQLALNAGSFQNIDQPLRRPTPDNYVPMYFAFRSVIAT